jgi:hypothetical protein
MATPPDVLIEPPNFLLLRPCPPERIALHSVGAAVGNVRNEGQELVAAVTGRFTT